MPTDHTHAKGVLESAAAASQAETPCGPQTPAAKLRAFLRSGRYRAGDELDTYNSDLRSFVPLGGIETADLRHQRERQHTSSPAESTTAEPLPQMPEAGSDSHAHALPSTRDDCGPLFATPFVALAADLCLHRYARREGCRRCMDSCPCNAIHPGEMLPQFDQTACRGCGACVSACASGALLWLPSTTQTVLQHLKSALAEVTEHAPVVIVHEQETDLCAMRPETVRAAVGLHVSTVGIIGMEILLSALALGASGVVVLVGNAVSEHVRRRIGQEIHWSVLLLAAFGFPDDRIVLLEPAEVPARWPKTQDWGVPPAPYSFDHPKRTLIRLAIAHLASHAPAPTDTVPLPIGAPFGAVRVDASGCTLCMACAGACKPKALCAVGGDKPGLQFMETRCVQCGLCAQVCPERAVTLVPRLNADPISVSSMTSLHQITPARCVTCGAPFASDQMIASILLKLKGHWMYGDAAAQKRLHMCNRCRVQDLFFTSNK